METLIKKVFYEDEFSSLSYQDGGDVFFLHSDIKKWNLSVYKNSLRVLNTFLQFAKQQGVTNVATITPNPAFAKLFGGKSITTLFLENKEHEVIIWELK